MKSTIWDFVFLIGSGALLIILIETDNIGIIQEFPYITILVAYMLGRMIGELSGKKKVKHLN